jgi:hypothetical protein
MTSVSLRTLVRAGAVLGLPLLAACTATMRPNTGGSISNIISNVTDASGTVTAVFIEGDRPDAGTGPTATVSGISVMLNGGSAQQVVSGSTTYTRVIVSVGGLTDYYELTLPAGVSSEGILLTANESAPPFTWTFDYAVGDVTTIGAYASQTVQFITAATGDIQISVSWNDTSDVDLHVIDPNGDEVYFGRTNVPSGGRLDIDSNAGCSDDRDATHGPGFHKNNENIVWPTGSAIPGDYKVFLDYYSDCGTSPTDWVVTVQRLGAPAQIFTGGFVGASNPDTVTTFTY